MTSFADGWLRLWLAVFSAGTSVTEGGFRLPHPLIHSLPGAQPLGRGVLKVSLAIDEARVSQLQHC